jgi:hypothetical protein
LVQFVPYQQKTCPLYKEYEESEAVALIPVASSNASSLRNGG